MTLQTAMQLRISQLLQEHGLALNGLCSICGITQSTLYSFMSGSNRSINVSTVQKICDGLEIDLPTFFDSDLFRDVEL